MTPALPSRVLSWYGDDFTGSTDVLEAVSPYMPSVLFLKRPDEHFFARFSEYAAFGMAGGSRSQSPDWMDANLPAAFEWLKQLRSAICHYKVCSTFDSSPPVGNIGRAMEIGKQTFGAAYVPIVVGAPSLSRYTVFGNLFAGASGVVHRIDRHPTMQCHPVTPMREADLRLHLKAQTELQIGLLNFLELQAPNAPEQLRSLAANYDAVLIDVMDRRTLEEAGRLLWEADRQPFVVGSSGVEYALLAHWLKAGLLTAPAQQASTPTADRLVVLSGSCSPVTQQQIQFAGRNGFELVRLDVRALTDGEQTSGSSEESTKNALRALSHGRSVVLYTSAAPEDRIDSFGSKRAQMEFGHALSEQAGLILNRILDESGVRRVVIAGGDTSTHAGGQLSIAALTFISHIAPGAPLCRTWSERTSRQDLEIVFKGGQCGREDFFESVLTGCGSETH